jgi:asparagine synthase (glutamine-hydrolysing)
MVCYLAHGFIPATHTAFAGIHVFPPACFALVKSGTIHLATYWALPDVEPTRTDMGSAEDRLESLLDDCVERCLDADVPVGRKSPVARHVPNSVAG